MSNNVFWTFVWKRVCANAALVAVSVEAYHRIWLRACATCKAVKEFVEKTNVLDACTCTLIFCGYFVIRALSARLSTRCYITDRAWLTCCSSLSICACPSFAVDTFGPTLPILIASLRAQLAPDAADFTFARCTFFTLTHSSRVRKASRSAILANPRCARSSNRTWVTEA